MRALNRERLAARARHAVYGSVIVLAVVIALEGTDVRPRAVVESVLAAAIATVLAEVYADHLAGMIREARVPTAVERVETAKNAAAGLLAAVLPVLFFVLAWIGIMGLDAAFTAAIWTGVGVVGATHSSPIGSRAARWDAASPPASPSRSSARCSSCSRPWRRIEVGSSRETGDAPPEPRVRLCSVLFEETVIEALIRGGA